ncbi:hypothetical protein C8J57DRAFT_1219202 [Mycena rebaudengoi]|nr:hypothetical protein C8J57DRAFT_1219202 [Mycena rebaudengoi]
MHSDFPGLNTAFIVSLLIDLGFQLYTFFLAWRFCARLEHYSGMKGPFGNGRRERNTFFLAWRFCARLDSEHYSGMKGLFGNDKRALYTFFLAWCFCARLEHYSGMKGPFAMVT